MKVIQFALQVLVLFYDFEFDFWKTAFTSQLITGLSNQVNHFKVTSENFLHDEAFEKKALQMCRQFYVKRSGSENDIYFKYITSGLESARG